MEFKKYQHIERLGTTRTDGLLDGNVVVMPKVDGTNGSLYLGDDGEIHAGSRKRELEIGADNQGFYGRFKEDKRFKEYFAKYPNHRLFGEYLKPHTLKTYEDNAWDKFYIFDVCVDDGEGVRYLPYDVYKPLLEEFGIDYIPVIARFENPTKEQLVELLEQNTYLIQKDCGVGEGVVIKNYDFKNRFGDIVWAKLVHSEFKINVKGKRKREVIEDVEKRIVRRYLTEAVVEKEYAKILNEDPEIERKKLIPKLLNMLYYTLITEESWNFVKDFKNPTIDFKVVFSEIRILVQETKTELFIKE